MQIKTFVIFGLQFCLSFSCLADVRVQSHDLIRQAAHDFLASKLRHQGHEFEITVGALDARLKLPLCQTPLEAFTRASNRDFGRVSVGVRCGQPHSWKIYTSAYAKVFADVVMLSRPVPRGEIISKSNVVLVKKDVSRVHRGFFTALDQVAGKLAKRPLAANVLLNDSHIAARKLIKRRQSVTLIAQNSGIDIRMAGEAMMDGEANQRIRVRNLRSNRVVEGIVVDDNLVRVNF